MINRVFLMGRLTRDPERNTTPGGDAVCNFSVVMNEGGKNAGPVRTVFVDVTCWKRTAEAVANYKRKGDLVFVDGRLSLSEWVDSRTQQKRSKLTVTAFHVQFLDAGQVTHPGREANGPAESYEGPEDWS